MDWTAGGVSSVGPEWAQWVLCELEVGKRWSDPSCDDEITAPMLDGSH